MIPTELVWCVAAAVCVSGRGALLVILLTALTLLFSLAVHAAWERKLPESAAFAAALIATAVGGALWRCLCAFSAQNAADLSRPLWLFLLFFLCGFSAGAPLSLSKLYGGAAALLTAGCVREVLCTASLFGFPLPFSALGTTFGQTGENTLGAGGLLVAAGAVAVWGIVHQSANCPPPRIGDTLRLGVFAAMLAAVCWLVQEVGLSLSVGWLFFGSIVAGVGVLTVWPSLFSKTAVFLPAVLIPLIGTSSLLAIILIGATCALLFALCCAILERLNRAHLPRRLAGPPLWLVAAAVLTSVIGAF